MRTGVPLLAIAAILATGATGGCSDGSARSANDAGRAYSAEAPITVLASFYPLQWMAEEVGGDLLDVTSLTPPGAEPHDLELTPTDVARVTDADVVVYLSGFQPAVDDAVAAAQGTVFDAGDAADLSLTVTPIEQGAGAAEEAAATDPHFWLDPLRVADVADAFAATLGQLDPAHADVFVANAQSLRARLADLDAEITEGLGDCAETNLVTSHNAFGYFADRYGLDQVGITGLSPEDEPSPADIAAVTDFVQTNDVRTIYFETLVSADIADTVAQETGARTEVLDPLEGLSDASEGKDYLEVMRSNLANLMSGQFCS